MPCFVCYNVYLRNNIQHVCETCVLLPMVTSPMVSVKTVAVGPEKTGPGKTVVPDPGGSDRSIVDTVPDFFYSKLILPNRVLSKY